MVAGLFVGYLLSTSWFSGVLVAQLQAFPALNDDDLKATPARAIVVLASGYYYNAPEYGGGDTVGEHSLYRIRYGAYLHRKTGLPVLVSGGNPVDKDRPSLAQVMADSLINEFGMAEELVWLEDKSTTSAENAKFSKSYLDEKGIDHALLVTDAWHMPRSVEIFERVGLKVDPAPTVFIGMNEKGVQYLDFLPSAHGYAGTQLALHEMLGRVWYAIRH